MVPERRLNVRDLSLVVFWPYQWVLRWWKTCTLLAITTSCQSSLGSFLLFRLSWDFSVLSVVQAFCNTLKISISYLTLGLSCRQKCFGRTSKTIFLASLEAEMQTGEAHSIRLFMPPFVIFKIGMIPLIVCIIECCLRHKKYVELPVGPFVFLLQGGPLHSWLHLLKCNLTILDGLRTFF